MPGEIVIAAGESFPPASALCDHHLFPPRHELSQDLQTYRK